MNAKEFLKQLQKIDIMIENKLAEVQQWKRIATGTSGGNDDIGKVKSSGKPDKMADAIAKYVDIEKEINEHIDRLIETKKDVLSVIERLDAPEYDLLHKIYVQYLTLDEVTGKVKKSYTWVTTTHKRALANVQKILDERTGFTAKAR